MKNKNIQNDKSIKKWGVFSFLLFLSIQLLHLIPPVIMKTIVDEYIPKKESSKILMGIILFVAIPFIFVVSQTLFNYFTIKFARNKGNEISIKIMENLINQPLSFFDNQNSMELVSYSSKESVNYINFYISELPKYYAHILIMAILLVVLFRYSPLISIIQIIFVPAAIFPIKYLSSNLEESITTAIENNAKISQTKADIFRGIELIKTLNIEKTKINQIEKYNQQIVSIWGKIAALESLAGIWIPGFLSMLFTGITFGVSAYLSIVGNLSMGALVSIMSYIGIFYIHVNQVFQTKVNIHKQEAEYQKLFSYLQMKGEHDINKEKEDLLFQKNIKFEKCSFTFENSPNITLENISMNFKTGTWTGIIGKSGSGKSTIFDLLLKLYSVKYGQIYIDNTDINDINAFDIRKKISRISQEVFLFPGTLRENLLLAKKDATEEDLRKAIEFACLTDYISSLPNGLDTDIGEAGKLMSGGERQRLSLAQGILRNNKILLLDEITSNVDPASEKKIRDSLYNLVKNERYTIISISHNIKFLEHANYIYEIYNGNITKEGSFEEFTN